MGLDLNYWMGSGAVNQWELEVSKPGFSETGTRKKPVPGLVNKGQEPGRVGTGSAVSVWSGF